MKWGLRTARPIEEILMPGGKPIGTRLTGPRARATIREVPGGSVEAERLFQELSVGGTDITPPSYDGKLVKLPENRGTVGFRAHSKSGPPTIDVFAVDAAGKRIPIRKIKLVG